MLTVDNYTKDIAQNIAVIQELTGSIEDDFTTGLKIGEGYTKKYGDRSSSLKTIDQVSLKVSSEEGNVYSTDQQHVKTPIYDQYIPEASYTNTFIQYTADIMLRSIVDELLQWEDKPVEDALTNIANIRDLIEKDAAVFKSNRDYFKFISALRLIFKNYNWAELTQEKLVKLRWSLESLDGKYINSDRLDNFYNTIYSIGISPLKT
ncbi:hypothetical protein HGA91_05915 [candidate division WWE3 bacterium]|nr:hypothetical protein [candidate division WWE3 bacterium]